MKINHIEVSNFRKYKAARFSFHPEFTVLIGNNASGKTTILDAIALLLNTYFQGSGLTTGGGTLKKDDARYIHTRKEEQDFLEPQSPVWLKGVAALAGETCEWVREMGDRGGKAKAFTAYGALEREGVVKGQSPSLPMLLYYGAGRLWDLHRDNKMDTTGSQLGAYRYCLDPKSDQYSFIKWFIKLTMTELQRKTPVPALRAVERAVLQCAPGAKSFYYDVGSETILIELKKEGLVRFSDLSDGYRNMVAMIADIAHRCARLNPQMGENVTFETKGIILIDELDLHLHPKWQRRVVPDLRKTFPNIQFITTSHSPFIIQSMNPGEIIDLDNILADEQPQSVPEGIASPAPSMSFSAKSIEDIVENVMDVPLPQRSQRYQEMHDVAVKYYQLLEQGQNAEGAEVLRLKDELDALSAPFSDNVAYHAFLEMERAAAGLGRSRGEDE
ncbi:AAA family ATPase [Escherichia coli]|nr:AAA family ATPase [Escherichia coli]